MGVTQITTYNWNAFHPIRYKLCDFMEMVVIRRTRCLLIKLGEYNQVHSVGGNNFSPDRKMIFTETAFRFPINNNNNNNKIAQYY